MLKVAGILYLVGDKHPHTVTAAAGHSSWLASAAFSRRGLARRGGGGHRGRSAVAEPSLAPDGMDRAGGRGDGPAGYRYCPAGRTGSRVRFPG